MSEPSELEQAHRAAWHDRERLRRHDRRAMPYVSRFGVWTKRPDGTWSMPWPPEGAK